MTDDRQLRVGVIMGSDSDLPVMTAAAQVLDQLAVPYELTIMPPTRTCRSPVITTPS